MPDVSLPSPVTWTTPLSILGVYIIGNGDFKISGNFSGKMNVVGKARVWITGDVKMTGGDQITITGGGSLDLYLGNPVGGPTVSVDFGGNGIVNNSKTAADCKVWGLPTCTDMDFKGNASLTAQVYAPNADISFTGTPDIMGSMAGKTIDLSGNAGVHYDESLGTANGPAFSVVSWEEL